MYSLHPKLIEVSTLSHILSFHRYAILLRFGTMCEYSNIQILPILMCLTTGHEKSQLATSVVVVAKSYIYMCSFSDNPNESDSLLSSHVCD